jgi:hypothetical protein
MDGKNKLNINSSNEIIKKTVGEYCKNFRINELNLTLVDFSFFTNTNFKTIWAFENGRSNNIKYLFYYYVIAYGFKRDIFVKGLFDLWQ